MYTSQTYGNPPDVATRPIRRVTSPTECRFHPRCPHAAPACTVKTPLVETADAVTDTVACYRFRVIEAEDRVAARAGTPPRNRRIADPMPTRSALHIHFRSSFNRGRAIAASHDAGRSRYQR